MLYTKGTIKENFDSIKAISGKAAGVDQSLKDLSDIRAFSKANVI